MLIRLTKLALGFLIGIVAGYAVTVMRPAAASDPPMEDFP